MPNTIQDEDEVFLPRRIEHLIEYGITIHAGNFYGLKDSKINESGYITVNFCNRKSAAVGHSMKYTPISLHQLVIKLYHGLYPLKPSNFEVHHIDRNKLNNHKDNLVPIPKTVHKLLHRFNLEIANIFKINKMIKVKSYYENMQFEEAYCLVYEEVLKASGFSERSIGKILYKPKRL